jgi:hypothetical protein
LVAGWFASPPDPSEAKVAETPSGLIVPAFADQHHRRYESYAKGGLRWRQVAGMW